MLALPLASGQARAASCCGAGSAAPTIITGDDSAQLSVSFAQAQVIGDAPAAGLPVFRADGDSELSQTLRIEGAVLLADRWQIGASLPLTRRARETQRQSSSASGVGDVSLSGAYEILPEWEYSAWRPRGFLFAQATLPTGGSVYEASFSPTQPWGLDSRGRGYYTTGLGTLLTKNWGSWDALTLVEGHRSFARDFTASTGESMHLVPGWGGSVAVGGGYSPGALPLRFGLTLSPAYEGSIHVESATPSDSEPQLVWNASAQLGWMATPQSMLSAVYSDQTLLGPARNVSLSRTVSILFQKRWER